MQQTIDVDASLLRRRTEAALHAARQTERHLVAEYTDQIELIMETLAEEEPYAYTLQPEMGADGGVKQGITTTRDGVWGAYEVVHGLATVDSLTSLHEIRGDWYTFHDSIGGCHFKETGEPGESDVLVLFPVGRGEGITGELFWARPPAGFPHSAREGTTQDVARARRANLALHERFLDALRAGDVGGIVDTMADGVQTSIRDYVDQTGTLTALDGKAALQSYSDRFFAAYDVRSVDVLLRLCEDWFVFAELAYTVAIRTGPDAGSEVRFHTAEFAVVDDDGRFFVRTGHGTDLDPT